MNALSRFTSSLPFPASAPSLLLAVSLLTITALVRPAQAVELAEAVERAVARQPEVAEGRARVEMAEAGERLARSRRQPTLVWRSEATRGDNPVYVFGSLLEQQSFTSDNFALPSLNNPAYQTAFRNGLALEVPVFSGFETSSFIRQGRWAVEEARAGLAGAEQAVRLTSVEAALAVTAAVRRVADLAERTASAEREVEKARRLNEKGLVLGSDYFSAQAVLSGLKAETEKAVAERDAALSALASLSGVPETDLRIPGFTGAARFQARDAGEWMRLARENRSDLRGSDSAIARMEEDARRSGREYWPRVDAFASVDTYTEDFSSNPSARMAGLRSRMSLGDFSVSSRRAGRAAALEAARQRRATLEEQNRLSIFQLTGQVTALEKSRVWVEAARDQSARALELVRPLYREGRQSILDVLRSEEGHARARIGVIEHDHSRRLAEARLLAASGTLDAAGAAGLLKAGEAK